MRLIDADVLLENYNLKDATKYGNRDVEQMSHSYSTLMLYEIADMIHDAPTVEARPVVYGEWYLRGGRLYCSRCDKRALREYDREDYLSYVKTDYCPNCGADMRGGIRERTPE